jgi:hypothetical protein
MKSSMMLLALLTAAVCTLSAFKATDGSPVGKLAHGMVTASGNHHKAPLILAVSQTYKKAFFKGRLTTVFNSTTANFYGSGLFTHWSLNPNGPFTNGVLPATYNAGTATYTFPFYGSGTVLYVFYSTAMGNSVSNSGATSPVYTVIVP